MNVKRNRKKKHQKKAKAMLNGLELGVQQNKLLVKWRKHESMRLAKQLDEVISPVCQDIKNHNAKMNTSKSMYEFGARNKQSAMKLKLLTVKNDNVILVESLNNIKKRKPIFGAKSKENEARLRVYKNKEKFKKQTELYQRKILIEENKKVHDRLKNVKGALKSGEEYEKEFSKHILKRQHLSSVVNGSFQNTFIKKTFKKTIKNSNFSPYEALIAKVKPKTGKTLDDQEKDGKSIIFKDVLAIGVLGTNEMQQVLLTIEDESTNCVSFHVVFRKIKLHQLSLEVSYVSLKKIVEETKERPSFRNLCKKYLKLSQVDEKHLVLTISFPV